jgi:hypothetical protein
MTLVLFSAFRIALLSGALANRDKRMGCPDEAPRVARAETGQEETKNRHPRSEKTRACGRLSGSSDVNGAEFL